MDRWPEREGKSEMQCESKKSSAGTSAVIVVGAQSATVVEKKFQRKLADGLNRRACRKQQEKDGVFLLVRLFKNRCMVRKRERAKRAS